ALRVTASGVSAIPNARSNVPNAGARTHGGIVSPPFGLFFALGICRSRSRSSLLVAYSSGVGELGFSGRHEDMHEPQIIRRLPCLHQSSAARFAVTNEPSRATRATSKECRDSPPLVGCKDATSE